MKTIPRWVTKVLSGLLVAVLVGVTANVVLSQTVFSSTYLDAQFKKADVYHKLSAAITDELVHNTASVDPDLSAKVQAIVTPEVLEQRIPGVLQQLETYLKNGGTPPQIDVSDLVAQARAAGVTVPADTNLDKPITVGQLGAYQVQPPSQMAKLANTLMVVAAVVLGAALVVVCWLRRDFRALAIVATLYGFIVVLCAALLWFVPDLFASRVSFVTANAFTAVGQDITSAIAKDIAKRLATIGGISFALGTIVWIILSALFKKLTSRQPVKVLCEARKSGLSNKSKNSTKYLLVSNSRFFSGGGGT